MSERTLPPAAGLRTHYIGALDESLLDRDVSVCGWVARIREHGEHLVFVDVRDHTGTVQCVMDGRGSLHTEAAVRIEGQVARRPEGTENTDLATGAIELRVQHAEVLGDADPLPLPLDEHAEVEETTRLRWRYLDLRRARMQRNLRARAATNAAIRRAMEAQGFVEVETPLLWTPTPEGAREFLVPSRTQPGSVYSLPQSPQIAKQLLMIGGVDRYYQIARCLRDEDLRADRQFEFTQLDLEASFVTQEDVRSFVSAAIREVIRSVRGVDDVPIGTITWHEAMTRWGSDKPDRRFGMELVDVTEAVRDSGARALAADYVTALVVAEPLSRSRLDELTQRARSAGAKGLAWFRVESRTPLEIASPLAKAMTPAALEALVERTGAEVGDTILVVADRFEVACTALGTIRLALGRHLADPDALDVFWVIDFPLFEGVDDEGHLVSAHHPFTMPHADDMDLLEREPLRVRSQSYDLVMNGWELGSGSIRIHRPDLQAQIFGLLGLDEQAAADRFGFLLDAFRFGPPPHGGFAFGIDRLVALLLGEETIREVIAFPKTQSGQDPMTGAPKPVDDGVLAALGLEARRRELRSGTR
ncbi:aspartyl-tRNA synthetase [Acidimicrobium ferrooxidans DSM 10331]|uniref:Aspartate--tRNA(Asp/Asn) ligase n=1 Tax=Acidimicrobium ferrooxidans (strain DSM 10331 / JCM 15462 / NBRC 103882 / ICP) TaxID=525909 RepID=C7M3A1_ACIFD|nr:aspartate--tRNA ligase [Acidimicrobium ferrooxidans]ACU53495.1 aspartyl-tRNA synthetase [Acidimicrobium ferrooxidans DSM 10331]